MTTETTKRYSRLGDRGFVLVVAAVLVAAITGVVLGMQATTQSQANANSLAKHSMLAEQIAERGMARALAEVKDYFANAGTPMDFDALLDPDLDLVDAADDYLLIPASISRNYASSSGQWGGWGTDIETVNGARYRRVTFDADGDGVTDAYLVRYDDNRDDTLPGLNETTNNNGVTERAGYDNPYRDRDQSIFITVVGLYGGTSYPARANHMLRGSFRSSGGKSVVADGYSGGANGGKLCGNGAMFCDGTITNLNRLDCICGEIRGPANVIAAVQSLPWCQTAYPGACVTCEGKSFVTETCTAPPSPPTPAVPAAVAGWMHGMQEYAGVCNFQVGFSGGNMWVHIWDNAADASCVSRPNTEAIITPDYNNASTTFPADCWAPVFRQGVDVDGSIDGAPANWAPGRASGAIVPLDTNFGALTFAATDLPTGVSSGTRTTGLAQINQTYASKCGCTSCVWSTNRTASSAARFNFKERVAGRLGAAGFTTPLPSTATGAPVTVHLSDGSGSSINPMGPGGNPVGVYFYRGRRPHLENATGTSAAHRIAIIATEESHDHGNADNLYLRHPLKGVVAADSDFPYYVIVTAGAFDIKLDSDDMVFENGIYAGRDILVSGQNKFIAGDMIANRNLDADSCNGLTIIGAPPVVPIPSTCSATGVVTANVMVGGSIVVKNNSITCASLSAVGNIELKNNGELGGPVWTGGQFTAGNNNDFDPVDANGSMLMARPALVNVQKVPF
jgi:hypothetical protein